LNEARTPEPMSACPFQMTSSTPITSLIPILIAMVPKYKKKRLQWVRKMSWVHSHPTCTVCSCSSDPIEALSP
jgi:hypothetical protein